MKYRKKMSRRRSKKSFTKGAMKTKKQNLMSYPMRGGYRL
jgi:hypothetical protein